MTSKESSSKPTIFATNAALGTLVSGTLLATLWPMKRPVVTAVLLLAVAGLAGCPIYDHENAGCYRDRDCASNYVCDRYGDCVLPDNSFCNKPSDCASTSTCTPAGTCSIGDCSFLGCVAGYTCDSSTGVWGCVVNGSGAGGASGQAGSTASAGQGGAGDQAASAGAGQGGQSVASAGAADISPAGAAAQ